MTQSEKKKFRLTAKWKKFRQKIRKLHNCRDYITGEKLLRTWNLHHICMKSESYTDISDDSMFIPLNKETHKLVHYMFNVYKHDKTVIVKLKSVLDKMLEVN